MSRKLSINYFSPQILQISQIFILSDRVELKKTSKTPLVMAEVYRPDVLSFRPVPESVLKPLLTPFPYQGNSNVPKLSPHSGKNIKKLCSRLDVCLLSPPSFGGVRGGEARGGSDEGSAATGEEKNNVRHIVFI